MRHKRHLLLLLLLLLAVPCFAQHKAKFHIVSFAENPHDMSPKNHEKLDPDGHPYAIIKVTSNNPDDNLGAYSFDFEHIPHIVEVKDGELWVYVGRNAMFVNISREGYHSIKRYDLGLTIRPGRAYEMQLSVEAPNVFRQMLEFNVQPSGVKATVMIKSSKAGSQLQLLGETDVDGAVAKSLELGVYTYTVLADKYHNSEGRIVLDKRNGHHIEKVTLRPNFSRITFKADAGTDIYINEEKVGHEIWNGEMEAGVYSVECRKPKHKSVVETIKIEENNDRVIELRKPIPQTGVLAVTSDPLGAMIKVDGKDCGITPKNVVDLLIGSHKVEISKKNYKSVVTTVEIREDETTESDVKLNKIAKVTINSSPKESQLYIGSKHIGTTPQTLELESGDYDIRLTKEGYHEFGKRIHVDISKPELKFSLKRQYQKKYSGYLDAALQAGSLMGVGANAGCYLNNFNFEANYLYGFSKETLYVNYAGGYTPDEDNVSVMSFGGKIGYGIVFGTRFRLTPQIGAGAVSVRGDYVSSSAITASVGMRCECALLGHLGLSLTPEYTFAVSKNEVFGQMENASSAIKGWGNGFNARLGLYVYF